MPGHRIAWARWGFDSGNAARGEWLRTGRSSIDVEIGGGVRQAHRVIVHRQQAGSYRIVVPFHFSVGEKKDLEFQGLFLKWCPEGDSNSHSFRKRILNPPRLPIPPSGLNGGEV